MIVDTCGWVDFLRAGTSILGDRVEQALSEDAALLCSVTVAELVQGVKGKKEKQQLEFLFAHVERLAVEDSDWTTAGHVLQALRAKGIKLPLTDALIAAVARRHGVPVLTVDAHFKHLGVALV